MNLPASLKNIPYFSLLIRISRKYNVDIWLVGGFLRDTYLGRKKELIDFDFCVQMNTISIVKEFSRKISSKFIVLDKSNESLRVILKRKNKVYNYDFTLMRGENLYEDLFLRDFWPKKKPQYLPVLPVLIFRQVVATRVNMND